MSRNKTASRSHICLNFFTIYLGEKNPPLNHTRFWVESLGAYFTSVNVYATHLQPGYEFKNLKFKISEIGGGSFLKRTTAILRLLWITQKIVTSKDRNVCLFHMTTKSLLIIAPILRLFRIPIFLWYSHQAKPLSLRLTFPFTDLVFTPTTDSFPIKTNKLSATGHGLKLSNMYREITLENNRDKNTILVIGRVARVKRIENLLIATSNLPRANRVIECIGPIQDASYLYFLEELARRIEVEFRYLDSMESETLTDYLTRKTMVFSGTQGSVDKAPLEAVANGCLLITANVDLQIISGMGEFWREEFGAHGNELSIEKQLTFLTQRRVSLEARNSLINRCRSNNNLDDLTRTMSTQMLRYV
jgi:hypothetical protein